MRGMFTAVRAGGGTTAAIGTDGRCHAAVCTRCSNTPHSPVHHLFIVVLRYPACTVGAECPCHHEDTCMSSSSALRLDCVLSLSLSLSSAAFSLSVSLSVSSLSLSSLSLSFFSLSLTSLFSLSLSLSHSLCMCVRVSYSYTSTGSSCGGRETTGAPETGVSQISWCQRRWTNHQRVHPDGRAIQGCAKFRASPPCRKSVTRVHLLAGGGVAG